MTQRDGSLYKDQVLAQLASSANVAQFVSFSAGSPAQRHSLVEGSPPDYVFTSSSAAVAELLARSGESRVNIRSFDPSQPRAHEFLYGLRSLDDILSNLSRLSRSGLYTIVNETIDVEDGGVSGVILGDVIECAPEDTPRCVEKPGTLALPRALGLDLLATVFGFRPVLDFPSTERVEFSLHPKRRGYRHDHTIIWEREDVGVAAPSPLLSWPNRFSRFIGDKVFGLLLASVAGLRVPATTVIARKVAPFLFGLPTGTGEVWLRTAPRDPVPGRFTTRYGWQDPFLLLASEDDSEELAAVIAQEGVAPAYSGAALITDRGRALVEGVTGSGEDFMLGKAGPQALPEPVSRRVEAVLRDAAETLGPVRLEWVDDGEQVWVVQMHQGTAPSTSQVIWPGAPTHERRFLIEEGLEALRQVVADIEGSDQGIVLVGNVGVTSHFGDVLRRARIPSRIEMLR